MLYVLSGIIVLCLLAWTYLTNPFSKYSIVLLPYTARFRNNTLVVTDNSDAINVRNSFLWRIGAIIQCGLYILSTRYLHQKSSSSTSLRTIISDIHTLRYDPEKLLLISGDHFNGLFVRNLGVFYYPMLDASINTTKNDWRDRQSVYLQSAAYALGVFKLTASLTTTIVPTGRRTATCVNFYAYPSDTVFGILYALASLQGIETSRPYSYSRSIHKLDTIPAAKHLTTQYKATLVKLYKNYKQTVYDKDVLLIKKSIHLSGAKDITKRESAFYDNVIFWKTTQLAMKLGVIKDDKAFLDTMKQTIIHHFWDNSTGYFHEDLSKESLQNKYYSSDWLIVLSTGFLDPVNKKERRYFERSINYIAANGIARPFAIKYQHETRAHRQFPAVRLAVASYGGDAIWSFWGMEYIKLLLIMYRKTNNKWYKKEADYHLQFYKKNIVKHQGFPEVYSRDGDLLATPFYKSIRMTGWVIGFEQALDIRRSIDQHPKKAAKVNV